jgi:hypothetical protein
MGFFGWLFGRDKEEIISQENSKHIVKPNVLADVLMTEFISNDNLNIKFILDKSWEKSELLLKNIITYKIAIVLLALLAKEEKQKGFKKVRENFEKLVFSPDVVEGMFFFYSVKHAMDKLSELFSLRDHASQWEAWAMSWLTESGINENNPARSFELALLWVDNYTTIMDSLKEFDPE